ncbi:purine-nucleoside phosphorylase [Mesoaciditoga sp.]
MKAVEYISQKIKDVPDVAVILGSGLSKLAEEVEGAVKIPYKEIPEFLNSTAPGHAGELIYGYVNDKKVLLMNGRFHTYEGYKPADVAYPIKVMKKLGIKRLIVTNAAGGIRTSFKPGELVFIKDIINFSFRNPLRGPNDETEGPRFPDMSQAFSKDWLEEANKAVEEKFGEPLESGTYISVLGPSYETPAEIRMFRKLGADMIGMSTIHEVIVANHIGMKVLGISCVTNMAAGVLDQPLSEEEVLEAGRKVSKHFVALVKHIIEKTC